MYCNRCGTDLPKNTSNCPRCGMMVKQAKQQSSPQSLNIVIACCFAVAFIMGTFLLVKNVSSKNPEASNVIIALAFFFFLICFLVSLIVFVVFCIKRKRKTGPIITNIFCFVGAVVFFILIPTSEATTLTQEVNAAAIDVAEKEELISAAEPVTSEPTLSQANTDDNQNSDAVFSESDDQNESDDIQFDHRTGDEIVGVSDKNIDDILENLSVREVRNDVTGNWRIVTIAESIQVVDYAASYYRKYFSNDDEIHAIVNFNYNTTTRISCYYDRLFVTVLEYEDGEEHDAKKLFGGMVLADYFVYLDNGDIEDIMVYDELSDDEILNAVFGNVPNVQAESASSQSAEPEPAPAQQTDIIVYITNTGAKYHRTNCRHLADSKIETTLNSARNQGYTPCGTCKPAA